MKDGTTHLAYEPEHAVDLDTGVIVAAPIHEADKGDTTTLDPTLKEGKESVCMRSRLIKSRHFHRAVTERSALRGQD